MQLVEKARLHLGLAALELPTQEGGFLSVHIGDAVSPEATVDGGFAGTTSTQCLVTTI